MCQDDVQREQFGESIIIILLHEVANGTRESKGKIKGLPSRCHLPVEERPHRLNEEGVI